MRRRNRSAIAGIARLHFGRRRNVAALGSEGETGVLSVPNYSACAFRNGIHTADSVEHCADDQPARILGELRTAQGIEGIDRPHEPDATFADQILNVAARNHPADAPRDLLHQSKERANFRFARLRVHD